MGNELVKVFGSWTGTIKCIYSNKDWQGSEIKSISEQLANRFEKYGLMEGENVAIVISNNIAFPVTLYALLLKGCNALLLHPSTTLKELEKISHEVPFRYFVHDFINETSMIGEDEDKYSTVFSFPIENINLTLAKLEALSSNIDIKNKTNTMNVGTILHLTSGTYGKPLICKRNQKVAIAEAVNYVETIKIYDKAKIIVTTPLNHAFAYGFGLISTLITDSCMTIDTVFNPKRLLRVINNDNYDILAIVPPMAKTLIELNKVHPVKRFPDYVFYAGSRCDKNTEKLFEETFNTKLYSIYGSTETGAIATNYSNEGKTAGLGRILNNVDVSILNQEKYKEIGEIGEVNVRSSSMMQGYLHNENELSENDYFPTGDIGCYDGNFIDLTGRIKDIINKGSMKIDPKEVESVLLKHPQIKDIAVYPGKSDSGEEVILAALTSDLSINLNELRNFCYDHLNPFKIPSKFHVLNEIPRTASGKCIKLQLPGFHSSTFGV